MLTRIGNKVTVGRPLCNVLRVGRPLEGGGSFLRDWTVYGKSEVVGSSVLGVGDVYGWAQVAQDRAQATTSGITYSLTNGRLTASGTATAQGTRNLFNLTASHVYLVCCSDWSWATNTTTWISDPSNGTRFIGDRRYTAVTSSRIGLYVTNAYSFTTPLDVMLQAFDLTAIFGSGNEPSTVDEFKAWLVKVGKMAKVTDDIPYFPYDAGSTFTSLPIVVRNRNIWNEEWETGALAITPAGATFDQLKTVDAGCYRTKNLIPVAGGTYYITSPVSANVRILYFNANGEFTYSIGVYNTTFTIPNNVAYIAFYQRNNGGVYPGGICINISDALNGTYTPHQSKRFPLVISSPLHGIGDVRDIMRYSDHGITRKYAPAKVGDFTWGRQVFGTKARFAAAIANKAYGRTNCVVPIFTYNANVVNNPGVANINEWAAHPSNNFIYILVDGATYPDVDTFLAAYANTALVYELATPTFEPVTLPKLPAYRDGTVLYTDTQVHGDTIAGEAPVGFSLLPPVTMTPPTGDGDTNGQTDDTATE